MDAQTNQLAFDILKELHVADLLARKYEKPAHQIDQILEDYLKAFDTVRKAIKGPPSETWNYPGPEPVQ